MFTVIPTLARSDTMSSSIALAVASPSFTMKSTVSWRHAEASFADSSHHTTCGDGDGDGDDGDLHRVACWGSVSGSVSVDRRKGAR